MLNNIQIQDSKIVDRIDRDKDISICDAQELGIDDIFFKTQCDEVPPNQPNNNQEIKLTRSFVIEGKGRTVEEVQQTELKASAWWPYFATGIWCQANEKITINVDNEILVSIGTRRFPYSFNSPREFWLSPGSNTISSDRAGLLYFSHHHLGTINATVTDGGTASPLFVLDEHTKSDWQSMLDNWTQSGMCEFQSNRVYVAVSRNSAYQWLNGKDPSIMLTRLEQASAMQDVACGLSKDASHIKNRPDPYQLAYIEDTSEEYYMYATQYLTGYSTWGVGAVLDGENFHKDGWGPWHEQGHTRQMLSWVWQGTLSEVTNNIYSRTCEREFDRPSNSDSDYDTTFKFFNQPNKNYDDIDDLFVQLVMFWQLDLAFGKNFYPKLHKMYREIAPTQLPGRASGELGKQWFVYMSSICANRNLTPFYEMWGIPVAQNIKELIKDLPTLQQDIWNSKDTSPIVEYTIADDYAVPTFQTTYPPQSLGGQEVVIQSAVTGSYYLSIKDNMVGCFSKNDSPAYVWEIIQKTDDTFVLKNKSTNQYLQEYSILLMTTLDESNASSWKFSHLSSGVMGHVYKIKSTTDEKVFDVDKNNIIIFGETNDANQRFYFDFLNYVTPPPTDPSPTQPQEVTGLQIVAKGTDLYLTWNMVSSSTDYRVYKSLDSINYSLATQTEQTMFVDKGAALYQKVRYFVRSVNDGIESKDGLIVEYQAEEQNNNNNQENNNTDSLQEIEQSNFMTIAIACSIALVLSGCILFYIVFLKQKN
ncbi:MAG: M60 family metallopeptidase [Firmicutes bacterium]|nr:M60 family metallopeptidase [Bacillota bacterium]